jgi:hypothetical protein
LNGLVPYIRECIDFSKNDINGYITFDGYYYEKDSNLPQKMLMFYSKYEKEPYKQTDISGVLHSYYNKLEEIICDIEFTGRTIIENTDKYSDEIDEGSEMKICFFPTNKQTLDFKILKTYKSIDEIKNRDF